MGPTYATVHLQGGPLGGTLAQAPLRGDGTSGPGNIIGLPVPVLDERAETFSWDTANYFLMPPVDGPWRPGGKWRFAYARTLPGYPTYTSDVRPWRVEQASLWRGPGCRGAVRQPCGPGVDQPREGHRGGRPPAGVWLAPLPPAPRPHTPGSKDTKQS